MISVLNIPTGVNSICIDYLGNEYIAYPCGASAGASFNILGTDVTSSVSSISYGQFTTNISATIDTTQYIVDDAFNAYFKVTQYTSIQSSRPTRI